MKYVTDYAKDKPRRDSLNALSQKIFGINVITEDSPHYMPFSFESDGQVIANVSAGTFHLFINGKRQITQMIQSVQTLPEYRHQGLIKQLFDYVEAYVQHHSGKSCLMAKRDLADFYQQFGYQPIEMTDYFISHAPQIQAFGQKAEKVDLKERRAREKFADHLKSRNPISDVFAEIELNWLTHWYLDQFFGNDLYYIASLNVFVVYTVKNDELTLFDIIGKAIPTIEVLFPFIGNPEVTTVKYFFTPDKVCRDYSVKMDEESYFFYKAPFECPQQNFAVPMLSRG